jgi:hypothetical protein
VSLATLWKTTSLCRSWRPSNSKCCSSILLLSPEFGGLPLSPYVTLPGIQLLPTELWSSSSQKRKKKKKTQQQHTNGLRTLPKSCLVKQISPGKEKKTPTTTKTTQGFCQELLDKSKLRRRKQTKTQQWQRTTKTTQGLCQDPTTTKTIYGLDCQ